MSGETLGATATWPWLALLLLGALHGLNPGMGWLFAVGLGVQQQERRAVWRSLLPLAVGHALAIAVAVSVVAGLGLVLPTAALRWLVVVALVALGLRQLRRHWHPRVGGMRVGARKLMWWSFLVATAHGAGMMAAPFALDAKGMTESMSHGMTRMDSLRDLYHAQASMHLAAVGGVQGLAVAATAVHTAGYLFVTALLAVIVYERAALHLLRRAWVNLDFVWAVALVLTAIAIALT